MALEAASKLFRGFSDVSRLSILEALRGGPRTVGELVEATRLGQPNASNHLACLLECGLVRREQKGRFAYYSLSDDRVGDLLGAAAEVVREVAQGVQSCPRYNPAR